MKKFDMLQELPQCDIGQKVSIRCWENSTAQCRAAANLPFVRHGILKHNDMNHSKTKSTVHIQTMALLLCKWIMVNIWFCVLISCLKVSIYRATSFIVLF